MLAKPLKYVGRVRGPEPEAGSMLPDGRMAKQHRRSVHREVGRPQGIRSPQKQFSPVMRLGHVDGDGVTVPEASNEGLAMARGQRIYRGSKLWHVDKEASGTRETCPPPQVR